jgi:hypothetical protein
MNAQPWYRHPMLYLVIGLPAAAVIAGFATLFLAMGGAGDAGDGRVRRVAQTQTADLAPDLAAAGLALRAEAAADSNGAVSLRFGIAAPDTPSLRLTLRHSTDSQYDLVARLVRAGEGVYLGRLQAPRAAGAYNAELAPEDSAWRLVGRLEPAGTSFSLRPALED